MKKPSEMAQGIGSEFKPQYHHTQRERERERERESNLWALIAYL
jgi:hypothetical protein